MAEVIRELELSPGLWITDEYCAFLKKEKVVVVSDLHLGYESVMLHEGVTIPKFQNRTMLQRLHRILGRFKPRRLIVAGDFKHEFSRNLTQEWIEVDRVLDDLLKRVEVSLVRGNHDNYLTTILSSRGMQLHDRLDVGGFSIVHGHKDAPGDETGLIIGHEHPSVRIRDDVGIGHKLPCYLWSDKSQTLVLPAFSPLASGSDLLAPSRHFISPPLKEMPDEEMKVYTISEAGLLDFSYLGALRSQQATRYLG